MNDNNFDNKYRYDAFFENELWLEVSSPRANAGAVEARAIGNKLQA